MLSSSCCNMQPPSRAVHRTWLKIWGWSTPNQHFSASSVKRQRTDVTYAKVSWWSCSAPPSCHSWGPALLSWPWLLLPWPLEFSWVWLLLPWPRRLIHRMMSQFHVKRVTSKQLWIIWTFISPCFITNAREMSHQHLIFSFGPIKQFATHHEYLDVVSAGVVLHIDHRLPFEDLPLPGLYSHHDSTCIVFVQDHAVLHHLAKFELVSAARA